MKGSEKMWEDNICGMLIRHLHMALAKKSDNALKEHDLTLSQLSALLILRDRPEKELTLKELERFMQVSQPAVAGIVTRLEKKDLVECFIDPSDKRVKRVRISSKGEQYCDEAKVNMVESETSLLAGMTEEERNTFRKLLQKASNNFR